MDEETREKMVALDEGRAAEREEYRQRAISRTTDLDTDLIAWFRCNLRDGRLGNGGMAGDAVDLLWRLEHRISQSKNTQIS
jgi:hypothetical protein